MREGYTEDKMIKLLTELKLSLSSFEGFALHEDHNAVESIIIIRNLLIGAINFVDRGSQFVPVFPEAGEIRNEAGSQVNRIIEA